MTLRMAIIGLGAVTRNIHLPAYAHLRDILTVVAGCDPEEAARRAVTLPAIYETPEEMLQKEKPDLVAVCTPPALHRRHARLALEHGCHVLCEKPLAESLEEADELIATAALCDRRLSVNTQFSWMPIYSAARRVMGAPEFGRLMFLHARQNFRTTGHTEANWRAQLQRRVTFEFGVHCLELVRYFFGSDPVSVTARMPNPFGERTVECAAIIALGFADGREASILLNRLTQGPDQYLELTLDGERASIHTSFGGQCSVEAGLRPRSRRPYVAWHLAGGGSAVLQRGDRTRTIARNSLTPFADATAALVREFVRSIRESTATPCSAAHHRATLAMALASYESARLGRTLPLEAPSPS